MNEVIIYTNENDPVTDLIIDWLSLYKTKVLRVSESGICKNILNSPLILTVSNSNKYIKVENVHVEDIDSVKAIFFRKYGFDFALDDSKSGSAALNKRVRIEFSNIMINLQFSFLGGGKKVLGSPFAYFSKIHQLSLAEEAGFSIPDTLITNSKKELLEFIEKHHKVITKSSDSIEPAVEGNKIFKFLTQLVTKNDLEEKGSYFFPGLFQRYIDKKYEVRVFYLDGHCYSMAIFSQSSENTVTDYRSYDNSRPNRKMPYSLPSKIERKIKILMKKLNLNTGSIDIIKSTDDKYVFLEVNPHGEFGLLSQTCNYYIEEKIALFLQNGKKIN